jgi:hypothetical protein
METITEEQLFNSIGIKECIIVYYHNNKYMLCHVENFFIKHLSNHILYQDAQQSNKSHIPFLNNCLVVKYQQ